MTHGVQETDLGSCGSGTAGKYKSNARDQQCAHEKYVLPFSSGLPWTFGSPPQVKERMNTGPKGHLRGQLLQFYLRSKVFSVKNNFMNVNVLSDKRPCNVHCSLGGGSSSLSAVRCSSCWQQVCCLSLDPETCWLAFSPGSSWRRPGQLLPYPALV